MVSAYNKFNCFSEDVLKGVHNFTSDATCTLTVVLCAAANAPVATNTILANLTQINYANLSSRVLSNVSVSRVGATSTLNVDNITLTATGTVAGFRYAAVFNDDPTSPADPLMFWLDYGSDQVLTNGETFIVQFPSEILTLT